MVRRYPVLTAVLAGVVAGLIGVAALALAGIDNTGDDDLPTLPRPGAAAELATDARAAIAPADPVSYGVQGDLGDLPDEGPAYRLERAGDVAGRVERLAEALGLDGDVRQIGDAWMVQDGDRVLRVAGVPGLPWSFGSERCGPDASVSSDGRVACAEAPPVIDCVMPPCPPGQACAQVCPDPTFDPPTPQESRADGERAADALFGRLGVRTGDRRVEQSFDGWNVSARREVGGLPVVGLETAATFAAGGELVRASGHLAEPDMIGDYPLVSTDEALERLRTGVSAGPMPLDGREPAVDLPALAEGDDAAGPDSGPGHAGHAHGPVTVTITGVRLGLLLVPGERDSYLEPAALFRLRDGDEVPVPAVTDEHLADVRPGPGPGGRPEPMPMPMPMPVEPGVPGQPGDPGGGVSGAPGQSCSGAASSASSGPADGATTSGATLELCGPGSVRVNEGVVFEVVVGPCEGVLDFGDGSSTPVKPGERTPIRHGYAAAGAYTVRLTAPACGPDGGLTHEVTVT